MFGSLLHRVDLLLKVLHSLLHVRLLLGILLLIDEALCLFTSNELRVALRQGTFLEDRPLTAEVVQNLLVQVEELVLLQRFHSFEGMSAALLDLRDAGIFGLQFGRVLLDDLFEFVHPLHAIAVATTVVLQLSLCRRILAGIHLFRDLNQVRQFSVLPLHLRSTCF